MKKLILALMLTILVVSFGTANARLSDNDAVPGQDVIIPIICEGTLDATNNPVFGGLSTNIAIAEIKDGSALPDPDSNYVVKAKMFVYNSKSQLVYDDTRKWTEDDVVVDNCKDIVKNAPAGKRSMMRVDMPTASGGQINLFAGYVLYQQSEVASTEVMSNRFIPWAYLVDLNKGFASGFNGVSAEDGTGPFMGEDAGGRAVTAYSLFPRFLLLNDKDDTFNWWIILAGRNELKGINSVMYNVTRNLDGNICNEDEICRSLHISIPDELNLIDVLEHLPNDLKVGCNFPTSSCGGFAMLDISESGSRLIDPANISILGTANGNLDFVNEFPYYSIYGWSYQRAWANSAALSWDVIHEIHRIYCSGTANGYAQGVGNSAACEVTVQGP